MNGRWNVPRTISRSPGVERSAEPCQVRSPQITIEPAGASTTAALSAHSSTSAGVGGRRHLWLPGTNVMAPSSAE